MRRALNRKQILAYLLGLLILAMGISCSVKSNLGCSPVASVPYTLTLLFHADLGVTTAVWQSFLVFGQLLLLRRAFRPAILLQLLAGFLFGYFTSFTGWILGLLPEADSLVYRIALEAVSVPVMGLGVWLYSTADVINLPSEGIVLALAGKLSRPFSRVKVAFDVVSVCVSGAVCLLMLRRFGSVGAGTIAAACLVGTFVGLYARRFGPGLRHLLQLSQSGIS